MKIDQKLYKPMAIGAGGLILLILLIAIIVSLSGPKKYTINNIRDFEVRLVEIVKNYHETNKTLPAEGEEVVISINKLVEEGLIKPLEDLIENGEDCSANIIVENNRGYFLYLPKIDCGERYSPQNLSEYITREENIVTTSNGLYESNGSYVFRGENLNNYIEFAGKLWVILRVNADGSLRIMEVPRRDNVVWDDRYNIGRDNTTGINEYVARDINSRLKDSIEAIYRSEEFSDRDRAHFLYQDLCIGKRKFSDIVNDGSIECSTLLEKQVFGIIAVYEFLQASLDPDCVGTLNNSCANYNYLATFTPTFWSLTADSETSYRVFRIIRRVSQANASTTASIRIVANISSGTLFKSGSGSWQDPYILV